MSLYNNIFDAHAHYDDKWFDDDRFELLENIHTKGVCGIVNNAVNLETAKTCIEYAEKYDFMYAAVGFHPENLENIPDNYLEQLAQLSKHKKVVAIGETGLDYHWDIPKDLQKRVFEEQIRLSLDLEMPLIVHDREAHGDVYDLLRKYKPNALVHCFSGSVELMREAVRMGMYISLGGVVTFKNARHSLEVASEIPLDRLLLETDAPYMAPVPFRGKRCDSSMIIYAAEKIASLRNIIPAGKPDPQQRHHPAAGPFLRRAVSDPQGLPRPQALEAGRRGQRRSDRVRPGIRPSGRLGPSAAVRVKLSRPVPPLSREFPVDNRDRACYIEG